jgi:RNA polymerase sigma factor (sigma-70 family)
MHRERGDDARLRVVWEALLVANADRIRAWTRVFRLPDGSALSPEDQEDAYVQALERFAMKLVATFRGTSVGELRAATKTLTHFACYDVARATMKREMHETALDRSRPDDEEGGADREHPSLVRDAGWAAEDLELAGEAAQRVEAALDALPNQRQAEVLRMERDGYTYEEIMAALDVGRDNAYQLRKRGMDKLRELLRDDH